MATTVKRSTAKKADAPSMTSAELFGEFELPYAIEITIAGVKQYFFSRPDMDNWERRENSAPGSRARKEVDPESLVWRTDDGNLAFPSTQLKVAAIAAGRYSPDPAKTGRRSAGPFIAEAIGFSEEYVSFGRKDWDAIDVRIAKYSNLKFGPRRRPILEPGWRATFRLEVLVPELTRPGDVLVLMNKAGMVKGIGDNTKFGYGRFTVEKFSEPFDLTW
jgi:hypothetical protein